MHHTPDANRADVYRRITAEIIAAIEAGAGEWRMPYLTGHIDDPCLPSKLFVAAFRQADDAYAIAWTRTNPQARDIDGALSDAPPIREVGGEAADQEHPDARLSEAALEDDNPFA